MTDLRRNLQQVRREALSEPAKPGKYLVVAPAWLGDMVMSQALIALLKRNDPDSTIHVLAPLATAAVAERMPGVERVILLPTRHGELGLVKRWSMAGQLRSEGYSQALVLPNSWKSALVPFLAGVPRRTGWRGELRYGLLNDLRVLDEAIYPRMVDRFMALGLPENVTPERVLQALSETESNQYLVLPEEKVEHRPKLRVGAEVQEDSSPPGHRMDALFHRFDLEPFDRKLSSPCVALCPGAEFGPAKRWPVQHYAAVADWCLNTGARVWIFGSDADRHIAEAILEHLVSPERDRLQNLCGKTELLDVIDLMALTDVVVTNDSGLMHVACAVGIPVVAVYGSTSPMFTPPLGRACVLTRSLTCQPCFARDCPLGHFDCLNGLLPERVIQGIRRFLPAETTAEVVTPSPERSSSV